MHRPGLLSRALVSAGALLVTASTLQAGVVHDEATDGDLSGNVNAPTPLIFHGGSNIVSGTMIDGADRIDVFTFTLAPGATLTAINLLTYEDLTGGAANIGFCHIDDGTTTVIPGFGNQGSLLGGSHIGSAGFDLLPILSVNPLAGSGFPTPAAPGDYCFLIQQTSDDFTGYSLDFVVDSPWTNEGCDLPGTPGSPICYGSGTLVGGSVNQVDVTNALPSAQSALFLALQDTPTPFKGGTLKPVPFFPLVFLPTSPAGTLQIPFVQPAGIPAGTEIWIQFGIADPGAPVGVALTNALLGTTP